MGHVNHTAVAAQGQDAGSVGTSGVANACLGRTAGSRGRGGRHSRPDTANDVHGRHVLRTGHGRPGGPGAQSAAHPQLQRVFFLTNFLKT